MKTKKEFNNNKGFTLVELSIVLVIIGLLIGGILVAQSMIGTARLQSGVRMLGQFDASVANFYTKFNQLPGDNSVMGGTVGDNNGLIMDANGTAVPTKFIKEIGHFWSDLSSSGLKPTGSGTAYTDASTASGNASTLVNTYAPQFPIGTNVSLVPYGVNGTGNYYMINAFTTSADTVGTLTGAPASALKTSDAAAIDAKIDDGIGGNGSVLGSDGTALVRAGSATNMCLNAVAATTSATYLTSSSTNGCGLAVRLGVQTGLAQ